MPPKCHLGEGAVGKGEGEMLLRHTYLHLLTRTVIQLKVAPADICLKTHLQTERHKRLVWGRPYSWSDVFFFKVVFYEM